MSLAVFLAIQWSLTAAAMAEPVQRRVPSAEDAGLETLRRQEARLARVSHAIRIANTDLCPERSLSAGWTLHNASQYAPRVRERAIRHFHFVATLPAVLAVAPGGPSDRAGIGVGDIVLAVNGRVMGRHERPGAASFEPLAVDFALIRDALSPRTMILVRRRGAVLNVELEPVMACAYEAQLNPSPLLEASADARRVFVSTAMVDFAGDDDELAAVIGHEYAHIITTSRMTSGELSK